MSENEEFDKDIRKLIGDQQVTLVVGFGVSRTTCPDAPKWEPLVKAGIDRCATLALSVEECDSARTLLKTGTLRILLLAAGMVEDGLRERSAAISIPV